MTDDTTQHEHGRDCIAHDPHWQDDSVYAIFGEDGAPGTDESPGKKELIGLLERSLPDDLKIYRFALVFVDEKGNMQTGTNPGMTPTLTINLLTRAASILAFQEAQQETALEGMILGGLRSALANAQEDGDGLPEGLPDLRHIFGHEGTDETEDPRAANPGGYL